MITRKVGADRAEPLGWYVGRPSYHLERNEWAMYAFDPAERPVVGVRSPDWTAKTSTELSVVGETSSRDAERRAA